MLSTEQVLQRAADDGSLEPEEWPRTLEYLLKRLDEIVDDFPKPTTPPSDSLASPDRTQPVLSSQESQTADKENAPPQTPPRPPVPAFSEAEPGSIPIETVNIYNSIRHTLSKNFAKSPPHTIQRLAELILQPKQRYKFLPSYLRALDRVVSVSSPNTIFPLPLAVLPNSGGLLNGTTSSPASTLGSDESLGGALLTPIPWLQNRSSELISESTEMVEGPHGAGRIETVSVVNGHNGQPALQSTSPTSPSQITPSHPDGEALPATGPVTQGEILRQEQEAGVVLLNPHSIQTNRTTMGEIEGGGTIMETVEGEDEVPHARGPEIIGMEDTGPQAQKEGMDIEGAVGRPSLGRNSKSPGPVAQSKDEEMKDDVEKGESEEDGKEGAQEEGKEKDEDMKTD